MLVVDRAPSMPRTAGRWLSAPAMIREAYADKIGGYIFHPGEYDLSPMLAAWPNGTLSRQPVLLPRPIAATSTMLLLRRRGDGLCRASFSDCCSAAPRSAAPNPVRLPYRLPLHHSRLKPEMRACAAGAYVEMNLVPKDVLDKKAALRARRSSRAICARVA
jgi:hypothetical protein